MYSGNKIFLCLYFIAQVVSLKTFLATNWQGFHILSVIWSLLKALLVFLPYQAVPLLGRASPLSLFLGAPCGEQFGEYASFCVWVLWNLNVHYCFMVCLVWLPKFSWFVLSIFFPILFLSSACVTFMSFI